MAFPKRLLAEHEEIVFDLRPHWIALVGPVLWTVALWVGLLVSYRAAESIFDDATGPQIGVGVIFTVLWLVLAVGPFLRRRFTMFVLTTDRLITRTGIIAKHSKEIPLERINDVTFTQTVLERVLGAGDLIVESAGERGQTLINDVRKAEEVHLLIYKEAEKNNNRMMRPPGSSIPEQIEGLARLREQGVITVEEFETKKRELLDRM